MSRPGDERYAAATATWHPQIEQRPVLVAEACGPDDVRAVVLWAREHDVPLAVQSTGHAGPGIERLHTIFVTAAIVAALGLLVVLYLRERPLRKDT